MKVLKTLLIGILLFGGLTFSGESGFTQEDRERLIRLEATLKTFMGQTNERFRELGEDMNKRFEQVDRRISELREDMNARFEQIDKRFEQVERGLDRLVDIMVAVFAGQFTLAGAIIAFAWWDRRTICPQGKDKSRSRTKGVAKEGGVTIIL